MPAQLPVEIIGRIIQLILDSQPKRSIRILLPLLPVSQTFRLEVERLIYANISLRTLAQVVKCFTTINSRPNLPATVRSLTIALSLNSSSPPPLFWHFFPNHNANHQMAQMLNQKKNRHIGRVVRPFGLLVTRTLSKLTHLQEYSLTLGRPAGRDEEHFGRVWLPADAPFKLRRFIVDLNLSPFMAEFLASQTQITDLLAPHFHSDRAHLIKPDSLPKLKGLVASAPVAAALVPARPVYRIFLKDQHRIDLQLSLTVAALPQFAKSSVPMRFFDVAVPDMTSVPESLWNPLGANLPDLESVVIRCSFSEEDTYGLYLSDTFSQPLSAFASLKHLVLPAPPTHVHIREAGMLPEANLPIAIHANVNAQIIHGGAGGALPPLGPGIPAPLGAPMPGPPPTPGPQGPPAQNGTAFLLPPLGGPPPVGQLAIPPGAPPFIQQMFNMVAGVNNGQGAPVGGAAAAAGPANPVNPPPAEGHTVFTQSFVIHGDATPPLNPPAPGPNQGAAPAGQGALQAAAPVLAPPAPAVHFGPPLPPGFNIGGPNGQPPALPNGANLLNLGAQLAQAATTLMNLFAAGPIMPEPNPPPPLGGLPAGLGPIVDFGDEDADDDQMPALEFIGPLGPGGAGPGAGFPMNWTTTFMGVVDPVTGMPIETDGAAPPPMRPIDPKSEEILDKAQRGLKEKELKILDNWKLGGFAPALKTVTFDMDPRRRTVWTWRAHDATVQPTKSRIETVLDDEPGEAAVTGQWEVEYLLK